jgi:uncharacterized DUF497 family protein
MAFLYEFEWDPVKAQTNFDKHGLDFERAATVLLDPLALTIPDEEHSETEDRWITLGIDATARYVMVVHTFETLADDRGPNPADFGTKTDEGGSQELRGTAMKPEYDFSKGKRGKFFQPNAELRLPIYLNADVQAYLTERAAQKGIPLGEMVNTLLKQEIQIVESVK